jgi:pimeloyl-ACP methyl ester carboxylesterase
MRARGRCRTLIEIEAILERRTSLRSGLVQTAPYRDVKANGIRLRVTDSGSGPTLLLLHTAFLDRSCWLPLVEALSADFRVVAPDLPGFGESEKPALARFSYTVDAFVHAVTDLFAGLGLGQAHVVGHGLGGAIAIRLASSSPELVSRLMPIDALCYPTRPEPTQRLANLPIVGGFAFKQLWGRRLFTQYFRRVLTSRNSTIPTGQVRYYYDTFNSPAARNSALATLRATLDTRSVRAALSRVSAPTLVVWGRYDAICSATFGQLMAREIRNSGFELLDTGHSPPLEAPARLAELVRRFATSERH